MKVELIRVTGQRCAFWKPDLQALTLPTLAALTPPDIQLKLTTERTEKIDYDSDADLIGLTFLSFLSTRGYAVADRFRRQGKTVVIGGPHATALPEETSRHADAVVVGEAESVWPALLDDFRNGRLQRFYQAEGYHSLRNLPRPRRDLKLSKGLFTISMVQTSRGCPFNCSYCYTSAAFGRAYRFRPLDEVVEEIAGIPEKYIFFADDNLIGNAEYAKQLFRRMIPLKKRWFSQLPITMARDPELLELAARSGCRVAGIGIESVLPESVKEANKSCNVVEQYVEEIARFHDHGIAVLGYFMFGFDNDDRSVFERTMEFIEHSAIDAARPFILTPLPNTQVFRKLQAEGRLLYNTEDDWSRTDGTHVCFVPKQLTAEELQEGFMGVESRLNKPSAVLRRTLHAVGRSSPLYALAASLFVRGGSHQRSLQKRRRLAPV